MRKELKKTLFEGKTPIGIDSEGNEWYSFGEKEVIKPHSNHPIALRGYIVEKHKDKDV